MNLLAHTLHQRAGKRPSKKGAAFIPSVVKDIRALNSSILIISQKIQYLVRNEKILGRNLLVLNRKLKELEAGGGRGSAISDTELSSMKQQLQEISDQAQRNAASLSELQSVIESIKQNYAKESLVKEIKFVVDSINPLEFVTYKEVEKLISEKMKTKSKK